MQLHRTWHSMASGGSSEPFLAIRRPGKLSWCPVHACHLGQMVVQESKVDGTGTRDRPIALDSGASAPHQDPAAEHDDAMWPSLSQSPNPWRAAQGSAMPGKGLPSPKALGKAPVELQPLNLLPEEKPMAIVGEEDGTNRKCAPALSHALHTCWLPVCRNRASALAGTVASCDELSGGLSDPAMPI